MHIVLQTIALLITNNIFFEEGIDLNFGLGGRRQSALGTLAGKIENTRSTDALDGIIDFSLNFYYHLVQ